MCGSPIFVWWWGSALFSPITFHCHFCGQPNSKILQKICLFYCLFPQIFSLIFLYECYLMFIFLQLCPLWLCFSFFFLYSICSYRSYTTFIMSLYFPINLQIFLSFFFFNSALSSMKQTVLKNQGWLFYEMSHNMDLSDHFFLSRCLFVLKPTHWAFCHCHS